MKRQRSRSRARVLCVELLEARVVLSAMPVHAAIVSTSTNWSGYAVQAAANSVSRVSGSWTVPAVTGSGTAYASVWVGIDGFSSSTVEQIGTDSDLVNGTPQYYAWYEMYPAGSVTISMSKMAIQPGDTITASVQYVSGTQFQLTIADTTQNETFTTTQSARRAQRSSAEWVIESPSSNSGVLPLANFGSVTITGASATIGGSTGPIDNSWSGTTLNQINMVSNRGATQDTTGGLTDANGTSRFTVTYAAATSPPPPGRHRGWSRWWDTDSRTGGVHTVATNDVLAMRNPTFGSLKTVGL